MKDSFYTLSYEVYKISRKCINYFVLITIFPFRLLPATSILFGPVRRRSTSKKWLDSKSNKGSIELIWTPGRSLVPRVIPKNLSPEARNVFNYRSHKKSLSTHVLRIPRGRFFSFNATITKDDYLLEDFSSVIGLSPNFNTAWLSLWLPRPIRIRDTVLVLSLHKVNDFYHWMVEVLMILIIAEYYNLKFDKIATSNVTKFQRQSLAILGIKDDDIIPLSSKTHIEADQLLVIAKPSGPLGYVPEMVNRLRDRLTHDVKLDPSYPEKIFITRGDNRRRRLLNDRELSVFLKKHGYVTIDPSNFSLQEQGNFFYNAKSIVALHGGALANMLFCQPGTKIFEILVPTYVNTCYWRLADELNLDYRPIFAKGSKPQIRYSLGVVPSFVDLDVVSEALQS